MRDRQFKSLNVIWGLVPTICPSLIFGFYVRVNPIMSQIERVSLQ